MSSPDPESRVPPVRRSAAPRTPGRAPGRTPAAWAVALVAAVVLAACGSDDPDGAEEAGSGDDISVAVASFDIAVGDDQRLMTGVFTSERELIAYGEVEFGLAYLGDGEQTTGEIDQITTADFLPVPGLAPPSEDGGDVPQLLDDTGTGVYAAEVDLDRAGVWGLRVTAELEDGAELVGQTRFNVAEEPLVVDVGQAAPLVENATIDDVTEGSVEPIALDSRAQEPDDEVPDPGLHERTLAETIQEGRPAVVAVATPVYCASRFCGPLVNVLADLADEYEETAEFIHLEVWEDFEAQQLNEAAASFIQTDQGGNEPWVFLIGADGDVLARWDNVLDVDELTAALDELA